MSISSLKPPGTPGWVTTSLENCTTWLDCVFNLWYTDTTLQKKNKYILCRCSNSLTKSTCIIYIIYVAFCSTLIHYPCCFVKHCPATCQWLFFLTAFQLSYAIAGITKNADVQISDLLSKFACYNWCKNYGKISASWWLNQPI